MARKAIVIADQLVLGSPATRAVHESEPSSEVEKNHAQISHLPVDWIISTSRGALAAVKWNGTHYLSRDGHPIST
jgi:hypothetical protein